MTIELFLQINRPKEIAATIYDSVSYYSFLSIGKACQPGPEKKNSYKKKV